MPTTIAQRELSTHNVHSDYAERAKRNLDALPTTALRAKIPGALDIMAHLATAGRLTSARLLEVVECGTPGELLNEIADAWWALEHMRITVLLTGDSSLHQRALRLYTVLARSMDLVADRDHLLFYLQVACLDGAVDEAMALMADPRLHSPYRRSTTADLLNPFRSSPTNHDASLWLRSLVLALGHPPTERLRLDVQGASPLDRLSSYPLAPIQDERSISVVTSSYNSDERLLTVVRSMRAQTWRNWEMIIVDDASDSSARSVLARAESMDPRVRVLTLPINGGTYRARNTALSLARGEFVTFLDSDDWAHPRFLERSVAPLLATETLAATLGWGARVTPDLLTTRLGSSTIVPAATTLMFRHPEVVDQIGFFDNVRKGADTEFAGRLAAALRRPIHKLEKSASILIRTGTPSLSASDFTKGWRHSARRAYRMGYAQWHSQIQAGDSDPYLDPAKPRRFPAPARWVDARQRHFDVIIAGDWRQFGGPQRSMLEEIRACRDAGLIVGIMHFEALRFMTKRDAPLCEPIRDLIQDGSVSWVHFDDDVTVSTLLLRYPPILQYPSATKVSFVPGSLFIVANQAPAEPNGNDQRYIPEDVTRNATAMFGTEPTWIPQGPSVRAALLETSTLTMTSWDNPGLIRVDEWAVAPPGEPRTAPVVGRYSRDNTIKFPARGEDLISAYGFPDPFRVHMMGASVTVPQLVADAGSALPDNWTLLPQGAMDVRDFLSNTDYFVYIDNADAHEAFGRVLLEAAASGILTVASPKHRATFGDALLYAEADEVVDLISRYPLGSEEYLQQSRRAQDAVRRHFSPESFVSRLLHHSIEAATAEKVTTGSPSGDGSEHQEIRIAVDPERGLNVTSGDVHLLPQTIRSDVGRLSAAEVVMMTTDGGEANRVAMATISGVLEGRVTSPELSSDLAGLDAIVVRDRYVLAAWTREPHTWSEAMDGTLAGLVGRPAPDGTHWASAALSSSWSVTREPV